MSGLASPRSRIITALNGAEVHPATREIVLRNLQVVEHDVQLATLRAEAAEAARDHAEREVQVYATRVDELDALLEAVERVLSAGRHAEVARRALGMIEREKQRKAA